MFEHRSFLRATTLFSGVLIAGTLAVLSASLAGGPPVEALPDAGPPAAAISAPEHAQYPAETAADHRRELTEISRRMQVARERWQDRTASDIPGKATVLLIMKRGDRGIRRLSDSADPVLCIDYYCYISRGAQTPAEKVPDRKAFGVTNTLGKRAGACRNSKHCVFRNVDFTGGTTVVQPVDLRVIRHDRRAPRQARIDRSCIMSTGSLVCLGGLRTEDYSIWIVPEALAEQSGEAVLLAALRNGLNGPPSARLMLP